jgi:hypothetical protein
LILNISVWIKNFIAIRANNSKPTYSLALPELSFEKMMKNTINLYQQYETNNFT